MPGSVPSGLELNKPSQVLCTVYPHFSPYTHEETKAERGQGTCSEVEVSDGHPGKVPAAPCRSAACMCLCVGPVRAV